MSIASVFQHGTFHVLHPELRDKDRAWLVRRSSFLSKWWHPSTEWVSWYGGAIRPDGGQGMYMTSSQAKDWVMWVAPGDIKAGPG